MALDLALPCFLDLGGRSICRTPVDPTHRGSEEQAGNGGNGGSSYEGSTSYFKLGKNFLGGIDELVFSSSIPETERQLPSLRGQYSKTTRLTEHVSPLLKNKKSYISTYVSRVIRLAPFSRVDNVVLQGLGLEPQDLEVVVCVSKKFIVNFASRDEKQCQKMLPEITRNGNVGFAGRGKVMGRQNGEIGNNSDFYTEGSVNQKYFSVTLAKQYSIETLEGEYLQFFIVIRQPMRKDTGNIVSMTLNYDIDKPPRAPEILRVEPLENRVLLVWRKNWEVDIQGYNVYYGLDAPETGEQNFSKITFDKDVLLDMSQKASSSGPYYYVFVNDLDPEKRYSFFLTAFDKIEGSRMRESERSNIVMERPLYSKVR